jgi:L-serine dehydratase
VQDPSILNDVLGPVMRGPSSSHTAGSFHIGRTVRDLLGGRPVRAAFRFDPSGSYAQTYRQQGVDLALAAGLMGWPVTDRRFRSALAAARRSGLRIAFEVSPIAGADHPNTVDIRLESGGGGRLAATAKSTGGGSFLITVLDGWPVRIDGKAHLVLVWADGSSKVSLRQAFGRDLPFLEKPDWQTRRGALLLALRLAEPPGRDVIRKLAAAGGVHKVRTAVPVYLVQKGRPLFSSAAEMIRLAGKTGWTLGRAALAYEAALLGLSEKTISEELLRRYAIMKDSVDAGLGKRGIAMQILRPSAHKVWQAERSGKLPGGGLHARAAARALAAMHVSNSMGVVCAAPTGGSAGVIPAVMVSLAEEANIPPEVIVRSLAAASAVGLILAKRATFAAEVAGCQVEIGAAGAMAAAAVVEAAGGTARKAVDAAAISFQNTMGSVCDLVQGMCEIPCHTRNAAAAAGAFVCADLIMGGYENPIPLDETIDAVFASGKMLPVELRCTARGGLAAAPSARRLPNLRKRRPGR